MGYPEARGEICALIHVLGQAKYALDTESKAIDRKQQGWQKGGNPEQCCRQLKKTMTA